MLVLFSQPLPISSTILFCCLFLNLAFFLFIFHVISCSIYLVYITWHKARQVQLCVAYGRISFFFKGWLMHSLKYVCCVCVSHFHTIHSSVDTYLGCFHALVIVTNTTMKVEVLMSFWHTEFIFFGCVPGSGITGLYRSFTMNFLRNRRSIFHSACTSLYSHRMYRGSLFSTSSSELLSFWW